MSKEKQITAELEEFNAQEGIEEMPEMYEEEESDSEEQRQKGVSSKKIKYYNLKKDPKPEKAYKPEGTEKDIQEFLIDRITVLKQSKKQIMDGVDFEDIMKNADREYQPRLHLTEKETATGNRVYLIQDDVKGLRGSRVIPVNGTEGEDWRSNISEPTLFTKVQTALSIIIDRNPNAVFKAMNDTYKKRTALAKAMWTRSWSISQSKKQFKLFVFDLAKYGWAIGRTYPKILQQEGYVLDEVDLDNPENNTYKKKTITKFNDIYRERLDPYRAWIDDKTVPGDEFSMNDWYFEKDFTEDDFCKEFDELKNAASVIFSGPDTSESSGSDVEDKNHETKARKDIVTLGFYENASKDLYVIWVPSQKIVLYFSPLPNDDKMLSCWETMWTLRDPRTPYGIGLYEIIKNNKIMYDRFENMTMDQLVLAIYPMIFYTGSAGNTGDDTMLVSPGRMKQKMPGTEIDQVKIDYDNRGGDMLNYLDNKMDESTGLTKTLQGEIAQGTTLGETLHAKDSALKRMNIPLSNICDALTKEGYLSLSWMKQSYSIPEVRTFVDATTMAEFELETGQVAQDMEQEEPGGLIQAYYYKTLELGLENREGMLEESSEDKFMNIGTDIDLIDLDWRGTISIEPASIVASSPELDRQMKTEVYNLLAEKIVTMGDKIQAGDIIGAKCIYQPAEQLLEISNEKPENWIPKEILDVINGIVPPPPPVPVDADGNPIPQETIDEQNAVTVPQDREDMGTVVPRDQIVNPVRDSAEAIQG